MGIEGLTVLAAQPPNEASRIRSPLPKDNNSSQEIAFLQSPQFPEEVPKCETYDVSTWIPFIHTSVEHKIGGRAKCKAQRPSDRVLGGHVRACVTSGYQSYLSSPQ